MNGRVLIAGFATRHVAQSAFHAGYEVCTVDHFCDQDLAWYTKDREKFDDVADIPDAIDRICRRQKFDYFVPTSGAEMLPSSIGRLGTGPKAISRFMDKLETQRFFESIDVPVPRILPDGEYPAMVKPRGGAGGWRNAVISSSDAMAAWKELYGNVPHICQEVVEGTPASTCCIATGSQAMAIATNEQILRGGSGESAYGFSGSVTPSSHPAAAEMLALAGWIAAESRCVGTIGIDFVLGNNGPVAIEVNPRFQGTVDTVEMATGVNLFSLHLGACEGMLPPHPPATSQVACRTILFADRDMTVNADLSHLKGIVADIPWPGTSLEEEQAIVSVYGWGPDRDSAMALLDKHITTVRQYMR
ncbi:MAG: ATP-grasp domain-containing protein [Methanomicrobiales archaeon]|nr:ATP-grasp domain-containing protein [Methanomicrobiales archaeon]